MKPALYRPLCYNQWFMESHHSLPLVCFEEYYLISPYKISLSIYEIKQLIQALQLNNFTIKSTSVTLLLSTFKKLKTSIEQTAHYKIKCNLYIDWNGLMRTLIILCFERGAPVCLEGKSPLNDNAMLRIVLLVEPFSNKAYLLHYIGLPVNPEQQ